MQNREYNNGIFYVSEPATHFSTSNQGGFNFFLESNRLSTFTNWPNPNISPHSLAKAGFFYLNYLDEVKCAWCQGVIAKWEPQDNAFEEHKRFFPNCPRVQFGSLIESANGRIRDLGIQKFILSKNGKYSSLDARRRSFITWPINHIQTSESLAQAGLFYQGFDDYVRCFHCNIGLRSWQKEDDPWFEHAKWFPECQFVQLAKGPMYVQQVQERVSNLSKTNSSDIEVAMSLPVVQPLHDIGIEGVTERYTMQQQISTSGCPFQNLEGLLKSVFTDPTEGPNSSNIKEFKTFSDSQNEEEVLLKEKDIVIPELSNTKSEKQKNNLSISTPPFEENVSLEEENRKLKDARLCKICLDEEVGVVFLPCGHLVTCLQCAPGVLLCPMCRSEINGFVRTFLS